MRKMIILGLLAATIAPTMASAQNGELRRDREQIREERGELRDARRYGDRHDVREERRDVREARREYRQDWRDYRRDQPAGAPFLASSQPAPRRLRRLRTPVAQGGGIRRRMGTGEGSQHAQVRVVA